MLIFLTNKVLSQRALDDNRLWEMVLEDHQKIVVLEAQLESLKTSINDLQRDLRDMKKGESRITWLVISNLMAIIIALVEVYVFHL
jgi:cell division protein FtsB